jgi:ribosomal protein S12 methylthiotransferase
VPAVALVTLGCARNEVDSEELAARLSAGGWRLVNRPERADVLMVNTCGFVQAAKKESIDTLLAAADSGRPVVAVGCLAERYGATLAAQLPEATILGFDDYPQIAQVLSDLLAGRPPQPHLPRDRRRLLPVAPAERVGSHGPAWLRQRLTAGPSAPLKIAAGCDRRCTFCAIPTFRGSFVSRPADDLLAEAGWLAEQGVRELVLTSENSTSYGKDLGDVRALERLLPQLAAVPGIRRIRVSYLQPAEIRPGLLDAIAGTNRVADYFDISFQHASGQLLRRMRRFGDGESFLRLLDDVRCRSPHAGVRTNVILGFPGERREDVAQLHRFLASARFDAVGVFTYSREDGTESAGMPGQVRTDVARRRADRVSSLVEELIAQRAEERIGDTVEVLVESVHRGRATGRAAHQGQPADGSTVVRGGDANVGDLVRAVVVSAAGVDLEAVAA